MGIVWIKEFEDMIDWKVVDIIKGVFVLGYWYFDCV